MKKRILVLLCMSILLSSCVDDKYYNEQGKDDAWNGKKNYILYVLNQNYKQGYDGAELKVEQTKEFSDNVKKTGDKAGQFIDDLGKSIDRFWKELKEKE